MTLAVPGWLLLAVLLVAGCGTTTTDEGAQWVVPIVPAPTTGPVEVMGEGAFAVLVDVKDGRYRTPGPRTPGSLCHWARLGELGGQLASEKTAGATEVVLYASDRMFVTSGCQDWTRALDTASARAGRINVAGATPTG